MSGQEEIFQEYQKMSASVDRLRREKRELEEECQVTFDLSRYKWIKLVYISG